MEDSWIPDAIAYQVNLRSLAMREPRNAFEAMVEKPEIESAFVYVARHLPKLKKLGVNLLYLMPPFAMGLEGRKGIGSPYAIRDFTSIESEYGSEAELAELVRKAHGHGMHVILDITPNHGSADNAWTQGHPEYFFANEDGSFRFDFDWSDTAKLNYENPDLRIAMRDALDRWLSFLGTDEEGRPAGIDGYRLDMAHMISDLSFWNETTEWLKEKHGGRQLLFLAESYGMSNNLDLFRRGINAAYDDDLYKIWQYSYARDENGTSVIALDDAAAENDDYADKLAAFREGGIAGSVAKALENYEQLFLPDPEGQRLLRYSDNHDEGRGIYRFGEAATRAISSLVFLCPHTIPMLLTGQEFGAANRPSIHDRMGTCDKGYRSVSNHGTEWHEGIEYEGNNFARGMDARQSWYEFYSELIKLRRKQKELTHGDFELLDAGEQCDPQDRSVVAFARRKGSTQLNCAVNLGPHERRLENAELFSGTVAYGGMDRDVLSAFSAIVAKG